MALEGWGLVVVACPGRPSISCAGLSRPVSPSRVADQRLSLLCAGSCAAFLAGRLLNPSLPSPGLTEQSRTSATPPAQLLVLILPLSPTQRRGQAAPLRAGHAGGGGLENCPPGGTGESGHIVVPSPGLLCRGLSPAVAAGPVGYRSCRQPEMSGRSPSSLFMLLV